MADPENNLWSWIAGDGLEDTVLAVVAGALGILAVADGAGNFLSDQAKSGATFAALAVILRLSAKLRVQNKRAQSRLQEDVGKILTRTSGATRVQRYRTYNELYKVLTPQLSYAERSLRLTHIREDPPAKFGNEQFYEAVQRWPEAHPDAAVRRIIAKTPKLRDWARELLAEQKQHKNLYVRVTTRSAGLPVINMVILDETDVFLFISGEAAEDTAGVWIKDSEVATYFIRFYDNLWRQCERLSDSNVP